MSKSSRSQSAITRQSDESYSEDHWLKQFEKNLQKDAVQPRGSLFDQINTIMNGKSKYPSVQAAVDDMMGRSGFSTYMETVKTSGNESTPKKTAQLANPAMPAPAKPQQPGATSLKTPRVIQQKPSIQKTLENIIKETRGNMPVPAIISRLHSLHANDISDESAWEDDDLVRYVSKCNLQAKVDNPTSFDNYENLGQSDNNTSDSDIDPSNTDAFNALMPTRL